MDSHNMTTHNGDASRPALGFPLGTALLLIVIFCLSGIFSCCYHWDRLRALRLAFSRSSISDTNTGPIQSPPKSMPLHKDLEKKESQSLPVIMPGDQIPKYIAWPCPCEPNSPVPTEKITIEV
ncbi:hypothetical protein MRB53_012465 [Persea americana]|uniref:Uncharacterized protein n=1 Tax=Persea americana TaxID=3435 RepID=A0ACC2LXU5_PERAE|nr:hypothetical protein MRB53_012465 [Persea americana]|eukprot:TRINITY_DN110676_c0_g1_i1.p1 TRINITY_DN110676_c0_g1~~TRINITY_DN110676_c0_g1_i1.p1  ORF type:complete len:123 (+),score=19.16 TRINITY_DN110676_c0_g1_i1:45-413(+)